MLLGKKHYKQYKKQKSPFKKSVFIKKKQLSVYGKAQAQAVGSLPTATEAHKHVELEISNSQSFTDRFTVFGNCRLCDAVMSLQSSATSGSG